MGGYDMISYRPFWVTLESSEESTYTLIKNHRVSSSTIDKLRRNKPMNTTTINDGFIKFTVNILIAPAKSLIISKISIKITYKL